jgi:phage gpG-like protein
MAIAISLTVRQKVGEKGSIEAWGKALSEPRPQLEEIGEVLTTNLMERFTSNTDPWGNAWAPPSPVTIALRGGDVERDLSDRIVARVEGTKVFVGLRSAVARIRQYGAPNNRMYGGPKAPIPPRPMLPIRSTRRVDLPRELLARIMETVRESLRKAARSAASSSG